MKNIVTTAALALAGAALFAQSAKAQYSAGDLLLGVRQPGVSSVEYIVDLGASSQFTAVAPGDSLILTQDSTIATTSAGNFTLGSLATDLATAFGSNWDASNSGVVFSVFGETSDYSMGTGSTTIWATNPNATVWPASSASYMTNGVDAITSIGTTFNNWDEAAGFSEVSPVGVIEATSQSGSYSQFQYGVGGNTQALALFNGSIEGSIGQSINVDELSSTTPSSTDIGTISIGATGNVTFTAVPEPSTYAMLGAGVVLLAFMARRQRANANA